MTIGLSRATPRKGYRFVIAGEVSKNANWVQTLDFPADGQTILLTGQSVQLTFRDPLNCNSPSLTLSTDGGQITVSDADTLSISVDAADISGLCKQSYNVDIASEDVSSVITHWASGQVMVRDNPASW